MIRKASSLACLVALILIAGSCRSRTDRTAGGVVLTFGNITGIPSIVSVGTTAGGTGLVSIGTFNLLSVVKDPTGVTSPLENVEITSYQVVYKRRDSGTRLPPTLVQAFALEVPVNGTGNITNLPILRLDQLLNPPLSDLAKFGHDTETGTQVIVIDCEITFFGQTLSGDAIASPAAGVSLEFVP
jgi:hypothetical protein